LCIFVVVMFIVCFSCSARFEDVKNSHQANASSEIIRRCPKCGASVFQEDISEWWEEDDDYDHIQPFDELQ